MNFPLELRFKLFALAPQIYVLDAAGNEVFYIKQKLFKLREVINVYADHHQAQLVATIRADRVLDFSAGYLIEDAEGRALGTIRRQGVRSLWRATYDLVDEAGEADGSITEENPFVKVLDGMLSEIPVVGVLSNYLFQPKYVLKDRAGTPMLRLHKRASLVDRRFSVEELSPAASQHHTRRNVLGLLMLVLLERDRS